MPDAKQEHTEWGQGGRRVWTAFAVNISLIVIIFSLGIFIGLSFRNNQLIHQEIRTRAASYFQNIVITRRWNASYGGVFVEKKEGVESNPYLEHPDIETVDGKVYTKKNPALMTREISELAETGSLFSFHITSLNPLNPQNRADRFEQFALSRFEQGEAEDFTKEQDNGHTFFRYMRPLFVEQSCLQCHAKQGCRVGEVRGGISVKFDITDVERSLRVNNTIIFSLAAVSLTLLLGLIHLFIMRLVKKVTEAQKKIEEMATTDELTGLYNRRLFFARFAEEFERSRRHRHPLSCLMIDIDHFKRVNDTYGHQTGDLVLKCVAEALRSFCRKTDIAARYGGEELSLLLPETDGLGAQVVAEKVRRAVEDLRVAGDGGVQVEVTVSIGSSSFSPDETTGIDRYEDVVKRADAALYRAKHGGRNRVEVW